ncbi:MAG: hypothetical protein IJK84_00080 [Bacteroidales bacterium]|nr:hypothetical protein [Bacteroidales bacterium]
MVKIGLVGKYEYTATDTTSCLLLVKTSSGSWPYQFHYLTDPKETFTDIVFIKDKWLVVPSRFEHVYQDHYSFGIRYESVSIAFGMSNATLPLFQTVQKFNTYYMNTSSSVSQHPTWHRSDVDIHIVDDPTCTAYAIVAYECEDTAMQCDNPQQTALFKLNLNSSPNITIDASQLVHGYFRSPRTFVGIKNVLDDPAMVLLHRGLWDDGEMASALLFPTWSHYGQIDGLLADYRSNTSLDVYKNRYIRLGGTSLMDNYVLHYHLNRQQITSSCYSTRPTFLSEELKEKDSSNTFIIIPEWINTSPILWSSYAMTYTSITNKNSCETNYLLKQ